MDMRNSLLSITTLLVLVLQQTLVTSQKSIINEHEKSQWKLVRAEHEDVRSISDLQDGVYLIQLAEARTECTTPASGMNFVFQTKPH